MTASQSWSSGRRYLGALLYALAVCGGMLALSGVRTNASAGSQAWVPDQIAAAPGGGSYVLWTSNDVASIWKMDSSGHVIATGAAYGPYSNLTGTWEPRSIVVSGDGSVSLLWVHDRSNGGLIGVGATNLRGMLFGASIIDEASIWKFDSHLNHMATGPAYGPYVDSNGTWSPDQFSAGPNGTTRLLWINGPVSQPGAANRPASNALAGSKPMTSAGGYEVGIWTFDANGVATSTGKAYGPYADGDDGWYPQSFAVAADGSSRLMWTNLLRTKVSFWTLNSAGIETNFGPTYGPFSGWAATKFDVNPTDGTLRLLWQQNGAAISVWAISSQGVETNMGPVYGPYQNWDATAINANSDGTSTVEWDNIAAATTTENSFWTLNSLGRKTGPTPVYGPISGWNLRGYSRDPATGAFRLLWIGGVNADIMSTWSLSPDGTSPIMGPSYGPYMYTSGG